MGFFPPSVSHHDSSLQSHVTFSFDVLTSVPPSGVMSELLSVMNRVAGERAGKDGKRWQHPSDFTRRYATFCWKYFCGFRIHESEFLLSLKKRFTKCFLRFVRD